MRRLGFVLLVALALSLGAAPASAQSFTQIAFNSFTADVTITTTTEKVLVSSGPVLMPRETSTVCVLGWAQVTTGTNTTTLTPMIRRGTAITGTAITEANAENVKAAAGSIEPVFAMACEDRASLATAEYSFTVLQASASGNGSAVQGAILVFAK
jgi:hypothetical protein